MIFTGSIVFVKTRGTVSLNPLLHNPALFYTQTTHRWSCTLVSNKQDSIKTSLKWLTAAMQLLETSERLARD